VASAASPVASPLMISTSIIFSTGEKKWSFEVKGSEDTDDPAQRFGLVLSPTLSDGVIYAPSYNGFVYALNSRTGEELWRAATGGLVASSPAVTDTSVYLGNYDGELHSINKATGSVKWSKKVSETGITKSSPVVVGDTVVVGDLGGRLHAVEAESGEASWSYDRTPVLSSPAVAGNRIYFSGTGGVYAVKGIANDTTSGHGSDQSDRFGIDLGRLGEASSEFSYCRLFGYTNPFWVWDRACVV